MGVGRHGARPLCGRIRPVSTAGLPPSFNKPEFLSFNQSTMLVNTPNLRALFTGYRTIFFEALHGAQPDVNQWAMRTQSSAAEEVYAWLGAVPGMRELIDEVQIRNLVESNYRIENKEWESTVAVKRASIERDTYGIYNPLIAGMGTAASQHDEDLLFELMVAGFTQKCYTGKNFFDTNHQPKKGGSKFSNKGTKKISAANFEAARANLKSRLNAEGRSMKLGKDLVLVVSPAYEATGREIVQADRAADGSTNVNKGTARLEVRPELAALNEDAWFLFDLGHAVKPFILQEELPVEFVAQDDPTDDTVFLKKLFLYQSYKRGNAGFGLPELAWGSTGEDAA